MTCSALYSLLYDFSIEFGLSNFILTHTMKVVEAAYSFFMLLHSLMGDTSKQQCAIIPVVVTSVWTFKLLHIMQ